MSNRDELPIGVKGILHLHRFRCMFVQAVKHPIHKRIDPLAELQGENRQQFGIARRGHEAPFLVQV